MPTYIALLRGVNVGGNRKLPNATLKAACERAGMTDVHVYLQSGNVVGNSSESAEQVKAALEAELDDVAVIVRSASEWKKIVARNPFEGKEGNRVHLLVVDGAIAKEAKEKLEKERAADEELHYEKRELYAHLPNGAGRSKLAAAFTPKKLGAACTARNWNTVTALLKLAAG